MKSWLPSVLMLFAVALLTFAGGTPEPESSFGSTAVVQLESAAIATPAAVVEDLTAGISPTNERTGDQQVSSIMPPEVETKFTEPPKPNPAPKPVAKAQQAVAANYGSCGPGGCGRRGMFGRRR